MTNCKNNNKKIDQDASKTMEHEHAELWGSSPAWETADEGPPWGSESKILLHLAVEGTVSSQRRSSWNVTLLGLYPRALGLAL